MGAAQLQVRRRLRGLSTSTGDEAVGGTTHDPDSGWCLAYGIVLHATDDGIVVEGGAARRVRLHDRALERAVVDAAAPKAEAMRAPSGISAASWDRAIAALHSIGAIVPIRQRVVVVDRLDVRSPLSIRALEIVHAGDGAAPGDETLRNAELVVVLARRADGGVGDVLSACRAAGTQVLLVWTSRDDVVVVRDDFEHGPCAECALFFDGAAASSVELPIESRGRASSDHERVAEQLIIALVTRFVADPSPLAPGRAFVWNLLGCTARMHSFPRRPTCVCARQAEERAVGSPAWEALEHERFRAVTPLADTGVARVAYRGTRSPWPVAQSAFGLAIAAGAQRRERALGEAVERFCMLHAPPSVVARARRELEAPALSDAAIHSLLFRETERAQPGFRFAEPSASVAIDWSWAERASTSDRVLVPTSLVGRPSEGSVRLVDATSNGYACHPSESEAKLRALLEVVERDALLLRWYTGVDPLVVEGTSVPAGTLALLATVDVDLPVVLMAACLEDGSLRIGSAASTCYETATERALDELEGQLAGPPLVGVRPDLSAADRGYGPKDHVAHYAGANGRALYDRWRALPKRSDAGALNRRWPRARTEPALATALAAVATAGLDVFFVDRSLPDLFGPEWRVIRALVPGAVEISWGMPYRRLASPRITEAILKGARLTTWPHPYA